MIFARDDSQEIESKVLHTIIFSSFLIHRQTTAAAVRYDNSRDLMMRHKKKTQERSVDFIMIIMRIEPHCCVCRVANVNERK